MTNNQLKNIAYLSLGSNVGDREKYLSSAIKQLKSNPDITVLEQSTIYETEPWPSKKDQELFLNQVIKIETTLDPIALLKVCQKIEIDLGRKSKNDWKPREIDIDILLFGDQVINSSDLQIPHKHMNYRQFVLTPLIEVNPELKDPISGERYEIILKNIEDEHKVKPHF